jgi:hypothetical protein
LFETVLNDRRPARGRAGSLNDTQAFSHFKEHFMNTLTTLVCLTAMACPPDGETSQHSAVALAAMQEAPSPQVVELAPAQPQEQRVVDLAICLDTSGSMSGLIDAAKTKLWQIVNDLALATPTPKLRVALLTFGNDGHNAENGWVNVDAAFTDDLDLISQKLFALGTNGGTELVGRVLQVAGSQLDWTPGDAALKIIVVAGNESADQDTQVNFRDACRSIIGSGVMINSIYCGDISDSIAPGWREVATLSDGHFAAIDHNHGTIVITTPFDDDLARLSAAINETYLPFGAHGEAGSANQSAQDGNAAGLGLAVAAQRCETKAGSMYNNDSWDLVDACKNEDFDIASVKDEDLPESMRGKSEEEKQAMIAAMTQKRADIQKQVAEVSAKRTQYVTDEQRKMAQGDDKSFDAAIRKAIREQAQSKGFTFVDEGC